MRYEIEILNRDELDRLLRACSRCPSGLRDRALIALMYGSGLRVSEALALKVRDIDLEKGEIRVHRGKGGKARVSGLEAGMAAVVEQWMAVRKQYGAGPLFCQITKGREGKAVSSACVRQMLARRKKRSELDKRVHAHGLRHAHAANLASAGLALNLVQKQLGHANVATTSRYIDHVCASDVVEAVRSL